MSVLEYMKVFVPKRIIRLLNKVFNLKIDEKCTYLFGNIFYYHHRGAFFDTYKELFEKGIYTFQPKSANPVIIDCGANMGLSLLFFTKNYPDAKIYAFEPDITVLDYLEKNIETYGMKNATLIKKAVWDKKEILEFATDKGMGGTLVNIHNKEKTQVETLRLKEFIGDMHIDLLKMDIEGAEYRVIKDCESKLGQIENIFIEYHSMEGEEQKLEELLLILKRNGYRYHLSESFSREKPFVDKKLIDNRIDMAINIYGYKS